MSRSTRESAATRALLARVEQKSTGKLTVGVGAVEISVYLLHGDLVAATAMDDDRQLVRLLFERGDLEADRAEELENLLDAGRDVFGELLAVGPVVDSLLAERFRQNLADYVSSIGAARYYQQKSVFVPNIQMGHDTRALIDEICAAADRAATVPLDALVVRGAADPGRHPARRALAELLGAEPRTVSSLLQEVALEPTRARCVMADLLGDGVARVFGPDPDALEDDTVDAAVPLPPAAPTPEPPDLDPFADLEALTPSVAPEPEPVAASPAADEQPGVPRSLSDWLDRSAKQVAEEDLDFFSDHDFDRGSVKSGGFTTEEHNLEKLEVASLADDDPGAALEADEAPAARFGAPVLSEDEALAKLEVANEVLALVAGAFDEAEGPGRGRAALQLLVDGCPSQFALLLHDIRITEDAELPESVIYDHLAARPATEHRQLLNGALVDLIERALSNAADELPDEQLDPLLESIAGYRQRLGL